ncbi:glycoside hydrolase family 3 protein [Streptomyces sp. NRRL F-5630]|uniref:glycoside hydrolase family 3 protein n=1 Tax=Streptomyces sp. NRRL F-5630 TaxID=1463864 RepID=UPI003D7240AB
MAQETTSGGRPRRRTVLAAGVFGTAAGALGAGTARAARPAHPAPARAARAFPPDPLADRRLLSRMTREEKVGQLFVMRFHGDSATAPSAADAQANREDIGVATAAGMIARYHLGGVIYFGWAGNIRSPRQVAALSNEVQRAGLGLRVPVPLLVSIDQEHGAVQRIGPPATQLPGAMSLGAASLGAGGTSAGARAAAALAGRELAALGVRQDWAPDADVNVNPANPVIGVRSFGADPEAVARLVVAQVRGYQEDGGISAAVKHFPGHGDTATDSHVGFPTISHSRAQWDTLDAPPFRAAIAAGTDVVMTGHLAFPALDPTGDPATLSHPVVTGVLRGELGYDGVVTTDSLRMEGVRTKYGDDRVPVLALRAGVDLLLDPPDLGLAHRSVLAALRSGELTEERIDASVLRVLALKRRRGLLAEPYVDEAAVARSVGTPAHRALADRLAERGTTLVVNDGTLPLRADGGHLLVLGVDPASASGSDGPATRVLARALQKEGFRVTRRATGPAPEAATRDAAVAAARRAHTVVVATYGLDTDPAQRTLLASLVATGVPVVAVALRNPYDAAHLPDGVRALLAAYGWSDVEVRAAARVLTGRARPHGRLPVPVTRADAPERTLYPVGRGLSYA